VHLVSNYNRIAGKIQKKIAGKTACRCRQSEITRRIVMRNFIFALLMLALGCDNRVELSPSQVLELERDCEILASTVRVPMKAELHLPVEAFPPALAALHPEAVYINEEGIYIRLKSKFVKESGFFYLRRYSVISPAESTDPSFERVGTQLYRYRIRG
jgi:hypothetical protein